ncbi:hypothetical protein GGR50DRAFT_636801, partial [Xylaria sp. CBS 124048]
MVSLSFVALISRMYAVLGSVKNSTYWGGQVNESCPPLPSLGIHWPYRSLQCNDTSLTTFLAASASASVARNPSHRDFLRHPYTAVSIAIV